MQTNNSKKTGFAFGKKSVEINKPEIKPFAFGKTNKTEIVKPAMDTDAIIAKSIAPILNQLCIMEKRNLHMQEQVNKLHELIFNSDNSIAIIEKLSGIEKMLSGFVFNQIAKPESKTSKGETNKQDKEQTINSKNAIDIMNNHFSGNIPCVDNFNDFFTNADFASKDTLAESFAAFNRASDKLLCARRSNKDFLNAAMQTFIDLNKTAKPKVTQKTESANSPVIDFKKWAKVLSVSRDVIENIINEAANTDFEIAESDYHLVQEYIMSETTNDDLTSDQIDTFLQWVESLDVNDYQD